jgi:hypothetical protein
LTLPSVWPWFGSKNSGNDSEVEEGTGCAAVGCAAERGPLAVAAMDPIAEPAKWNNIPAAVRTTTASNAVFIPQFPSKPVFDLLTEPPTDAW